jgi:hypothetical protein
MRCAVTYLGCAAMYLGCAATYLGCAAIYMIEKVGIMLISAQLGLG